MRSFKDQAGQDWLLSIDCDAIDRVQALTGIDLASPFHGEPPLQQKLALHVPTQVKVLWALCRDQAEKSKIDRDAFTAILKGGTLQRAVPALLQELADFFQQFGMTIPAQIILESIEALTRGMKEAADQLASGSAPSSTSAPESAESIPAA